MICIADCGFRIVDCFFPSPDSQSAIRNPKMDGQVRAGIDLYGTVLRYAEVERHGGGFHLLRLGSCDFDFDVAHEMLHATHSRHVDTVAEALVDVFEGSTASRLYIMLHPPTCYSFFTPLRADLPEGERRQRVLREAALLMRSGTPQPLRLTADPVYTEQVDARQAFEWFHVLALSEKMQARFERICRSLPQPHHRMTLSMQAVAGAVEQIERAAPGAEPRAAPFTLAVGWYPSHVEYSLCRAGRWHFSHYTDAGPPEECAYFAQRLLGRLQVPPAALGRIFLYGSRAEPAAFASLHGVFGLEGEPLNAIRLVDVEPESLATPFDPEAYAPCIGGVL
jgi:hypothetical protein